MTQAQANANNMPPIMEKYQAAIGKLFSFTILFILLATIAAGTSENMHAQMLKLGEAIWPDYYLLRGDAPATDCVLDIDIEQRLDELEVEYAQENADFDLFESEFDRDASRQSLQSQLAICQKKHDSARIYHEQHTTAVKYFKKAEHSFANLSLMAIGQQKTMLISLLMLSACVVTWSKRHIAFRAIRHQIDHYLSTITQLLAHICLGLSTYAFYKGSYASGTEVSDPHLMIILMLGCLLLSGISIYQLLTPPGDLKPNGQPLRSLLTIPIHTYMLLVASYKFFLSETHLPGISIYFTQVFQLTNLHLAIGLYILAGMLLKETQLGSKLFAVLKPWKFPPEALAFLAITLMAYPTAYTGASGIIIIAMGAVVYQEMRRAGTRRQLSLAVTAMTGSGVVLRPCLLVVGIAILNEEVVTDELFYWGFKVFLIGLGVFAFYAAITRKDPFHIAPWREALTPSLKAFVPLFPYVGILAIVLLFYGLVLDSYLDEFSAPVILPVIILVVVLYERLGKKPIVSDPQGPVRQIKKTLNLAVDNSAVQIGALLMLMAASFTVGGVIERAGGELVIPTMFASQFAAMTFLVLFLVMIGMVMDPFGALILVTGTIAPVAYSQGIHPIHFWLTCLMAFELGYVSPPVALNHLLARQVVGDDEVRLALTEGHNFYYRNERLILPLLVMATTLIIVAFGPLIFDVDFSIPVPRS